MPRYSGVTFAVQPVEKSGEVSGYVIFGFFSKDNSPSSVASLIPTSTRSRNDGAGSTSRWLR